ncbi:MAG: hypothetical protein ACRD3G_21985 [Vicinamibacterales bacterium]
MRTDIVIAGGSTTVVDGTLRVNIGNTTLAPDGIDPTDPALARAVYEVILPRATRNAPGDIAVVRVSVVPPVLARAAWTGSFAAVAELRPTLDRAADRRPVWLRREAFPDGARLVASPERERRVTWFTPVFFTADLRRAVVYYHHLWGSLCAEGVMVWLTRTDAGVWQIGGSQLMWIS